MKSEVKSSERRETLRHSVKDGVYYSLMVGLAESYLPAFLLALGFSQISSGFIVSLPMLIGSILQLGLIACLPKFGSRQRFVRFFVVLQGLMLMSVAMLAFWKSPSLVWLFGLVSLYWAFGLAAGPVWNAWMGSVVPAKVRVSFFTGRARINYVFVCLGLMATGFTLRIYEKHEHFLFVFAGFLMLGGLFRILCGYHLNRQLDSRTPIEHQSLDVRKVFAWIQKPQVKWILLFLFAVQVTSQIASPYFNPFMLKILNLNYSDYMGLLAISLLARVGAYMIIPRIFRQKGAGWVIATAYLFIIPLPWLWTLSSGYLYLACLQILSGLAWGAFEQGVFLTLFDSHADNERARILTWMNVLNCTGGVIGSAMGAKLLSHFPIGREAYHFAFDTSTLMRCAPLLLLPAFLKRACPPKTNTEELLGVGGLNPSPRKAS